MTHSRRDFLSSLARLAVAGAAAALSPSALASVALAAPPKSRRLFFEHTHTGKSLDIVYAVGDRYVPESLTRLNAFLCDHYTGRIGRMDPRLFDLLYRLRLTLGSKQPIEVVSAYRTAATNAELRRKGQGGVAKKSLHMEGKAMDLNIPGVSLADLRDAAKGLRKGGVGYYPHDGFVHVDTGPVRTW
jgi:uncharacterized protein YcbK (DUF882 family)